MLAQKFAVAIACLSLAGCGLPRGAGFESEVLAASNANTAAEGEEAVYDFAVYDVNRETLPLFQGWPTNGPQALSWLVAQEQPASLIIAPGDTVQMTIWDAEENSIFGAAGVTPLQPAEVNSGGKIFVPYIGDLQISGMSPSSARMRIEEELIRTVPSAQVQLSIEPGRANTANVVSGMAATGLYPLPDRNHKILDLFSQAGGPDPTFNSPMVRLVRAGQTFGIPFYQLLRDPRFNIAMRGGDRVYVEDDDRQFITLGATGAQSIFDFPEVEFSALEALAFIGGVNGGSANPEGILIMREYEPVDVSDGQNGPPKQRVVFKIDLTSADGLFSAGNFMLEDDDLIYGTESALGPALTLFGLTNTVSSLVTAN